MVRHLALPPLREFVMILFTLYRAFSRDVMSAILVYLNNEKFAMLVYQISPAGVELFCNAKTFFYVSSFQPKRITLNTALPELRLLGSKK